MTPRSFLFLQGVATPFFRELGKAIRGEGHQVYRVNFCGGDRLFASGSNSWRYNKPLSDLPHWLQGKHQEHHFTDVVLFGDTRPVHQEALVFLRSVGVTVHVFEEGYLRPHWLTLEQDGVNGFSKLLDPAGECWSDDNDHNEANVESFGNTFTKRAYHDISYRLANAALKPLYRKYKTHRPVNALFEYAGWAKQLPSVKLWHSRRENKQIQKLISDNTPYYVFPLQLDADSQIRMHSPFNSVYESIKEVIHSFAKHAPANTLLIIKNHPLATGVINHQRQVDKLSKQLNLQERIIFLHSGHLPTLLKNTQGTVLVNSTTGTSALFHGSPVCALGTAIFNKPGLTFQQGLDRFWTEGEPAAPEAYQRFRNTIIRHSQINGDFYSAKGIRHAVRGSLKRMRIERVHPVASAPTAMPPHPPEHHNNGRRPAKVKDLLPTPAFSFVSHPPEKSYQHSYPHKKR